MAKRYNVSAVMIDQVKRDFDRFDENKNGVIDQQEFRNLLVSILKIKERDLSANRVSRFFKEVDLDGNGAVDFAEFTKWYLKYFNGDGSTNSGALVHSMYESFNPEFLRRRSL